MAATEHSLSVGPDGPVLLQDLYLIEQTANFNRERFPERLPHARGGGAPDRFSTVAGKRGSPYTWRDQAGFAVRFYTSEGNLDIVGTNTPFFSPVSPSSLRTSSDRAVVLTPNGGLVRGQFEVPAGGQISPHPSRWEFPFRSA